MFLHVWWCERVRCAFVESLSTRSLSLPFSVIHGIMLPIAFLGRIVSSCSKSSIVVHPSCGASRACPSHYSFGFSTCPRRCGPRHWAPDIILHLVLPRQGDSRPKTNPSTFVPRKKVNLKTRRTSQKTGRVAMNEQTVTARTQTGTPRAHEIRWPLVHRSSISFASKRMLIMSWYRGKKKRVCGAQYGEVG